MDAEKYRSLLSTGEGQKVEFKEQDRGLAKEMVAFANTNTGHIFIGVNDDGRPVGVSDPNSTRSNIQDTARNCEPPVEIEAIHHFDSVLVATIPASDRVHRSKDGYYIRQGANSQKLTHDEIKDLMAKKGEYQFGEQANREFSYPEDFDTNLFEQFLQEADITENLSNEEFLKNLRLARIIDDEFKITNAGVLLFGKNPKQFFPHAEIRCTSWEENDRSADFADREIIEDPLLRAVPKAEAFVERNIDTRQKIEGWKRKNQPEIPAPVFREAILNAVMHREYLNARESTAIEIFPEKIQVRNPGGLVAGMRGEDLGKKSVWRNPIIADILDRAGYVERTGTGIRRMTRGLVENGFPEPQFDWNSHFEVKILREKESMGIDLSDADLNPRQKKALEIAYDKGRVKNADVREEVGDISRATITKDLNELVERGLLERRGKRRGAHYVPPE